MVQILAWPLNQLHFGQLLSELEFHLKAFRANFIVDITTALAVQMKSPGPLSAALDGKIARLEKDNCQLAEKTADPECLSRLCYLRVISLPEGIEGNDCVGYLAGIFAEVLPSIFQSPCNW
ncbi:hypothetical protein DPEC_G00156810 [Dallia pectoralis]|uniref:Uncharacterized protein n=1 Tax=Dallia pectoralis TaxID=75939 RepID=A0ACC2GL31_DALPE|nr:hypothetical protein DPEC_G00156810 [Dallia pectoralis]